MSEATPIIDPSRPPSKSERPRMRWWREASEKLYDGVCTLVRKIDGQQAQRRDDLIRSYRLYGNFEARGLAAGQYSRPMSSRSNRLTLNVIKSCVDTVVARIGKALPHPRFLTSGGSWSQQQRAKMLDKFVQGIFYQCRFPIIAIKVLRDALVFGKGCVKILEDKNGRVRIERVFPDEILVDDVEAIEGEPKNFYQRRIMSRDELMGMFPELEEGEGVTEAEVEERNRVRKLIAECPLAPSDGATSYSRTVAGAVQAEVDVVEVLEAWHLPLVKPPDVTDEEEEQAREEGGDAAVERLRMKGHDGRHAIVVTNGTLMLESWRDDYPPFVFMECSAPIRGFWPVGFPIELRGIQVEINKISRKIQESVDWSVPKAFIEMASKVVTSHIDDIPGVIKYSGTKPDIMALQTISPELLAQVDRLIRQAYEMVGVSQLAAAAKKPAGLESGQALREYNELQSDRFATIQGFFEQFAIDVAQMVVRMARKIAERDGDYAVSAPMTRGVVEEIAWSEINLDDDSFVIQVFPVSALPRTPAGRLQMVNDLVSLGFLEREDIIRLLNFPDLETINRVAEASAQLVEWQVERMVERGIEETPLPWQNLAYALKYVQSTYMRAVTMSDVSEAALERLLRYMQACTAMMEMAAGAQHSPAPGAQPGVPPGGPGAPPPPGMGAAPAPPGMPLQ